MRAIKLSIIIIIALAVCAAVVSLPKKTAFECGDSYTFFIGTSSADCKVITVDKGAELLALTLTNVCGEATTFKTLDTDELLEKVNGKILFSEQLSDSVNYYCSADLPYSVTLYGQKVNLHICIKADSVTVASPIIFGGY